MTSTTQLASAKRKGMPLTALLRSAHLYIGTFIAPSLLFFALTGSLQLFSLHETHGAYVPPSVVEKLGMLHKDQVFTLKPRRPVRTSAATAKHVNPEPDRGPPLSAQLLKVFFLCVAVGLAISTGLGLWMGLALRRRNPWVWAVFVVGGLLPLVLLML